MPAKKRIVSTGARILLGLIFTVFGLNGFLNFLPQPPLAEPALSFFKGLMAVGYFLPLLKATEVVTGILLLSNRFVPLALVILAPVVVQIVAFHIFVAPSGLPVALVVLALEVGLARTYRAAYAPLLRSRSELTAPAASEARGTGLQPAE